MFVAGHLCAEQSEHMANHFQHEHFGNWKVEDFLELLKESANEYGPDSEMFGSDRQDQ